MKIRKVVPGSMLAITLLASASLAQGVQRTFVSGLGNDGNPCSRTASCRTFGRAISQTNAGGEVIVLDSAGYGPFAIAQAVTVQAPPGVYAGISVFSGDGIDINAGASDTVILRGLTVTNQGSSGDGIRFNSGGILILSGVAIQSQGGGFAALLYASTGQLQVESCFINGFGARGIDAFGPSLSVKDTIVRNSGFGILTSSGPGNTVTAEGIRLEGNQAGLFATNGARVSIRNSVISGNSQQGIVASGNGPGSFVEVNIEGCMIAYNGTDGVNSDANGSAIVRISNSIVTDNDVGLHQAGTAVLLSRGNNTVEGNKTADTQGAISSYTAK